MGLTNSSIGAGAVDGGLDIRKNSPEDKVIAIAGNPNVGKSTVFNGLTGMNQHTGNWPGKTVANAWGCCSSDRHGYVLVDIPGTYSLMAHSAEEEVARNFLCFDKPDAVVVVCDATCLERNLNLVLQCMELSPNVVVCVNLMDEAKRKGISIDIDRLSELLGVPVIQTVARQKKSLNAVLETLDDVVEQTEKRPPLRVRYNDKIEGQISRLEQVLHRLDPELNARWFALRLLEDDEALMKEIADRQNHILEDAELQEILSENFMPADALKDEIVSTLVHSAHSICTGGVVHYEKAEYSSFDRRVDKVLTGRVSAFPLMLLLLAFVFWLTIEGANYPSGLLSNALFWVQNRLTDLFEYCHAPDWLHGALVLGVYRVLAWVVSVMLPPMAIFFPLFTLLEDAGYLPRIAYNLDRPFRACKACGKQALTMCMGFGCNAAGIVGCRIIDSPRERLLAILTNNFVPCNGRFPTLISILSMFFIGAASGMMSSVWSALLLTLLIVLAVAVTFGVTKLLSCTLLKGMPSSFTLEMPPYRRPQIGKVIVRSIFDRTLFVLGRAASVAAPAGLLIWLLANIQIGDASILHHAAEFLDPFAALMGLDGVILIAFILGFPANEIVLPIILMAYMAEGTLPDLGSLSEIKALLLANGWTWITAISTMLFCMFHWPCSTTLLTVHKETGSLKWTALSAVLPTALGVVCCMLFTAIAHLFV